MTYQEVLWQGKAVLVASLYSKRGKIHNDLKPYLGRCGIVKQESKNGMLLVDFATELKAIPAGCLSISKY